MIHFLHTYHPSPILISLGPVNIYWYGFFIIFGIILASLITIKLASYYQIKKEIIIDLLFWLVLSGIIGARVYDVLLELPYYLAHPLNIFKIWQGGLAIHGAIIGGILTVYFFSKKYKTNFWLLSALITPGLALAMAIGRWGNYFNQELFGRPTNLPWGIPIDTTHRPLEYINVEYFHPTFLYESLGNLLIFVLLIIFHIYIIKKRRQNILISKFPISNFQFPIFIYLILYSILRFTLEFLRIDPTPEILGLRWPQIVSLLIIAASIVMLLKNLKRRDNINTALTYHNK